MQKPNNKSDILINSRLAIVLSKLGFSRGDCVHAVVGNHHYSFLAIFAALYLGGSASLGDVALDSETISQQV